MKYIYFFILKLLEFFKNNFIFFKIGKIKRIRDNSMLKDIKIIFVTAVTGAKETATEAGVETTIEKPFTNEQLLAAVEKAIG